MRLRQLNLSSEFIFIATITLLLVLVPDWAVLAAPQSRPVASTALVTEGAPSIVLVDDSDSVGRVGSNTLSHRYRGRDRPVDRAIQQQYVHELQGIDVTKTVTPAGLVEDGDTLTYTLVISAVPGVQVNLYDPLTDTTFVRFAEHPPTDIMTYTAGAITGTLMVTPTRQVTVSFAVLVDLSGTVARGDGIANRACIVPSGLKLNDCVWSNEVINRVIRSLYLPLVVRDYAPVQADFLASPTSGPAPLTVVFTNTSVGGYDASAWDFGDGITSTQTSPTHTYTVVGTFTVTLAVGGSGETDTLSRQNYITVTAPLTCVEGIDNGGFEEDGDWELPITEYTAAYTTAAAHSGNRSMRVGILDPADNRYSYSSARQLVTIPPDVISATLRFWLYPISGEPPAELSLPVRPLALSIEEAILTSDRQYVLVLNEYGQWINTLVWQRTNDQQWTFHEFDLTAYAGQTIKLHFGAYNDGSDGVTAMYVDDVSLEVCAKTTMPPNRPSNPTPSDGAIGQSVDVDLSWTGGDPDGDAVIYDVYLEADDDVPDLLVSESQSSTFYNPGTLITSTHYYWQIVATDENGATTVGPIWDFTTSSELGTEIIINGGFESDSGWTVPTTEYPASYTTAIAHSGSRSMRTGIIDPSHNRYSYSSVRQAVTIPADAISATLGFWLYPITKDPPANLIVPVHPLASTIEEAALAGDRQYVLILNEYDQWINTLVWQLTNDQRWTFHKFDLGVYVGRTIKLQFGAYNDGWGDVTAMYVDDVSLEVCYPSTVSQNGLRYHSDDDSHMACGGCCYRDQCGRMGVPQRSR